MKVLVIDEARAARTWARVGLLRLAGVTICEAENGPDGIAVARQERPDAILLGVRMPGIGGSETLAALRGDPVTAAIPVLLVAAQSARPERERPSCLGAQPVLYKPFLPECLAAAVAALI